MSDTAVSASATEITFRHSNDQRLDDLLTRAFLLPYASTPSTPADGPFDFHPSATAPCLRHRTRGFHPFPPSPSRSLSFPLFSSPLTYFALSSAPKLRFVVFRTLRLACQRDAIAFYFSPSLDRSPRISRITRKTISRRMANSPMIGFLRDRTRRGGVRTKDRNLSGCS